MWENPYEVIDTVPVVPAYPPIMTFCAIRKDGDFLYLLKHDQEREWDFIPPEQARRMVDFLSRASACIEREKPRRRSITIPGRIKRFLRRVFNTYHGYRFVRAMKLRNTSGEGIARFCVAYVDGDDRYGLFLFYHRSQSIRSYRLDKEVIERLCSFVE